MNERIRPMPQQERMSDDALLSNIYVSTFKQQIVDQLEVIANLKAQLAVVQRQCNELREENVKMRNALMSKTVSDLNPPEQPKAPPTVEDKHSELIANAAKAAIATVDKEKVN